MRPNDSNKKYVIFGAGFIGAQAADFLGNFGISFYIDNNSDKIGSIYCGYKVYSLNDAITLMKNETIIIAVSEKNEEEIKEQLKKKNITNYKTLNEEKYEITREKLINRTDYISVYNKAINWIISNTTENKGIITTTAVKEPYPEVSGYYIPTLINWGYKELAIQYAKWLCSLQHDNGAWYDTGDNNPYIFDTAQILKGLIAVRKFLPDVDEHIIKGCDWILSNMTTEGRLVSPLKDAWGDGKTFSELIHTYCISPIREAGELLNIPDYIEKADLIAYYYTTVCKEQILNFDLLSHFYAYVMEAMLDIGREDLAIEGMKRLEIILNDKGYIPAYNNVDWVCSTGLFQLSLVWYRLGKIEEGNQVFEYACKLQNETGGWYGSYVTGLTTNQDTTYFPNIEISWVVKYFLDALYYRNLTYFENQAHLFCDNIEKDDGRYMCIKRVVYEGSGKDNFKVLDVGCGKGRYLKNLCQDLKGCEYYAVDLSKKVMEYFDFELEAKNQGTLTNIPYGNNYFDVVYTCEALEHAVDIKSAVKELCRVTKSGGKIAILDKNIARLGLFDIEPWEQWFDIDELKTELMKYCDDVTVEEHISYDNNLANGLFCCWIGTVR